MPLINRTVLSVPVIVQSRTGVTPAAAFEVIVPIDLSLTFRGWGPFPAVLSAKNQTGPWDHVGASRNPDLSDGSTATETLTEYIQDASFAYELTGFTNILGRLVDGVRGEWTFTPDGDGCLIRWCYEFKPKRGRHQLVQHGLAPLWRRYMTAGLHNSIAVAEEHSTHTAQ